MGAPEPVQSACIPVPHPKKGRSLTKPKWQAALTGACFLLALCTTAGGSEQLTLDIPTGFDKKFEESTEVSEIHEWVPKGETVQDWTQMITLTVAYDLINFDPLKFFDEIARNWEEDCPDYAGMLLHEGLENNYPVAVWFLRCPKSPMTGRPEFTYFKGISGKDGFYTVQKAYAAHYKEIDEREINISMKFLKQARLCHTLDLADHPCVSQYDQNFLSVVRKLLDRLDRSLWENSSECLTQKVDLFPMTVKKIFLVHSDNPEESVIAEHINEVAPDTLDEVYAVFASCGIE